MTVENCYWTRTEEGRLMCLIADDNVAPDFLQGEGVEMTPVKEFDPCCNCDHFDQCMDNRWNEGNRMGEPSSPEFLTAVHTCKSCGKKSLSVWGDEDKSPDPKTREVPDKCPRWHALHGSGLDCDGCTGLRMKIRKSHPRYEERAKSLTTNLVATIKGEKDPKEAAREMAAATMPGFKPGDVDMTALALGQIITGKLLSYTSERFPDVVTEIGVAPVFIPEWLQWMVLAFEMDRSPEFLAQAFALVFNDTPPFSRVWLDMSLADRIFLVRTWEGLIRSLLGDGT